MTREHEDFDAIQIELQACDAKLNRFRSWRVDAARDLFGHLSVRVVYGRLGTEGQARRHEFDSPHEVRRFLRECLRRRATAEKRISVRYRVVDASPDAMPLLRQLGFEEEPCSRFAGKVIGAKRAS